MGEWSARGSATSDAKAGGAGLLTIGVLVGLGSTLALALARHVAHSLQSCMSLALQPSGSRTARFSNLLRAQVLPQSHVPRPAYDESVMRVQDQPVRLVVEQAEQ